MVSAHLLHEGLLAANHGRIDDEIPVAVGVANRRRWPVFSRRVTSRGLVLRRLPAVRTAVRHDYLLVLSGSRPFDMADVPSHVQCQRVIAADELIAALDDVVPSELPSVDVVALFDSVSKPLAQHTTRNGTTSDTSYELWSGNLTEVAEACQRLVSALAR